MQDRHDELRARLDAAAAAHEFRGVALVWRDGRPLFHHAVGTASRRYGIANTVDTRFHVASVTKMFTATAALQLVGDGRIGLDQPLVDVLPAEHRPRAMTAAHTLRHLLSHTSGLTNYHDDEDDTGASWAAAMDRVGVAHARRPADMLPLFADLDAHAEPGTTLQYADANYLLVALVIEAVTGRRFDDVILDDVASAAGCTDTSFTDLDLDPVGLATGYQVRDDIDASAWPTNVYAIPAGCMSDGGMITTTTDLARFLDALVGGRLLPADVYTEMIRPHGAYRDGTEAYGLGLELYTDDSGRVTILGHAGGDPGVSAMVSHHAVEDVHVIVLCNQDRGSWAAANTVTDILGIDEPRV